METTASSSRITTGIVFSIIVIIVCYVGAVYAIFDMTHSYIFAPILATLACLDFILARFVLRRPTEEPSDVWYIFAAIFLIAAFASTLVWWTFGVLGASKIVSITGSAVILLLRVIVVNIIGVDEKDRLFI